MKAAYFIVCCRLGVFLLNVGEKACKIGELRGMGGIFAITLRQKYRLCAGVFCC